MADETTPQPGTESANLQDALKVDASKTTFGFASVSLPTPKWANAAFDVYLIITTSFLAWIVADNVFSKEWTQHIFYFLTLFTTPIVKGISKMFGVAVDQK
jgi:hypothetical protein